MLALIAFYCPSWTVLGLSGFPHMTSPLTIFMAHFLTNYSKSVPFLYWKAQKRTQNSRCVSPVLRREHHLPREVLRNHIPRPWAGDVLPNATQDAIGLLCHKCTLLARLSLSARMPRAFFAEELFSWLVPILCWHLWLFLPHAGLCVSFFRISWILLDFELCKNVRPFLHLTDDIY